MKWWELQATSKLRQIACGYLFGAVFLYQILMPRDHHLAQHSNVLQMQQQYFSCEDVSWL